MGRIKTTFAKRKTKDIFKKNGSKFSTDFDSNKKQVDTYTIIKCKKIRNIIAGYMTRLKRAED